MKKKIFKEKLLVKIVGMRVQIKELNLSFRIFQYISLHSTNKYYGCGKSAKVKRRQMHIMFFELQ